MNTVVAAAATILLLASAQARAQTNTEGADASAQTNPAGAQTPPQTQPTDSAAPKAPARPEINRFYRSQEDWSVLADPALRTDPFDLIKYRAATTHIEADARAFVRTQPSRQNQAK
jgi:hypothetical protein